MDTIKHSLNSKKRAIFAATIVALSLLAGMIGSYFASSFDLVLFGMGTVNEVTPDYAQKSNLIIREAKNVVVQQNDQTQSVADNYRGSIIALVRKDSKSLGLASKYYDIKRPAAEAIPVTSDGWLISNFKGQYLNQVVNAKDFLAIDNAGNRYTLDKIVKSTKLGLYFIKIKGVDLKVEKISNNQSSLIGNLLISTNQLGTIESTQLTGLEDFGPITVADQPAGHLQTDAKFTTKYLGVLSLAGDLVGVVNERSELLSATNLNGAINSLLKLGQIKNSSLGLSCLDLSQTVAINDKSKIEAGCMVYQAQGEAVTKGGAADLAGIKTGDIILAVNDQEVRANLSELVSQYLPGEKIIISISRAGKQQDLSVTLQELK